MKETLRNIWRRKARSFLTISGVAIGIFAFTTMGAMAASLNSSVQSSIDYFGSRISVTAQSAGALGAGAALAQGGQLPASVAERIKVIDGVKTAYPTITIQADPEEVSTFASPAIIYGYRPEDAKHDPKRLQLASGRDLRDGETGKVVIGSSLAQQKKLQVGDTATVRDQQFQVVGILARTNGLPDTYYALNLSEAQGFIKENAFTASAGGNLVSEIVVIPQPGVNTKDLTARIKSTVRGVDATDPETFTKQIEQASVFFNLIILGSALVAVVVGGLSVINTMIMSVSERRKELAIKRVVGAKARHIIGEVLLETSIMGLIGGLLGFGAGAVLTYIINSYTKEQGLELFMITPDLAIASIGFAALLGALAGLYPAWRASRIKPVTALRGE